MTNTRFLQPTMTAVPRNYYQELIRSRVSQDLHNGTESATHGEHGNFHLFGDPVLRASGGIKRLEGIEPDRRRQPQRELSTENFRHHSKTNLVGGFLEGLIEKRGWK